MLNNVNIHTYVFLETMLNFIIIFYQLTYEINATVKIYTTYM